MSGLPYHAVGTRDAHADCVEARLDMLSMVLIACRLAV